MLVVIPHVPGGAEWVNVVATFFGLRSAGFAETLPLAVYAPNCSISFVLRFMARNILQFKNTIQAVGM